MTGRLARQIERTRKLSFPDGEDTVKYWFRPPPPPPIDPSKWKDEPDDDERDKDSSDVTDEAVSDDARPIENKDAKKEESTVDKKSARKKKKKKEKKRDKNKVDKKSEPPAAAAPAEKKDGEDRDEKKEQAAPAPAPPAPAAIALEADPGKKQKPPTVPDAFRALALQEDGESTKLKFVENPIQYPALSELLIRVDFSSLNDLDVRASIGDRGIVGKYPLTPGCDAAGVVAESTAPGFEPGDEVLVTGFDLGTHVDGGFGRYIRVPAEWAVRCPRGMSLEDTMAYGSEGFAAAMAFNELERSGVGPRSGEVLVTSANKGTGCIATALLAQAGYEVTAVADEQHRDYLTKLGAANVMSEGDLMQRWSKAPLLTSVWAGIVDTQAGELLELGLKEAQYGAAVICCGAIAGARLETTMYPFLIRSVRMIGVDSAFCPVPLRNRLWRRLSNEWRLDKLESIKQLAQLDEVESEIERHLGNQSRGRVVIVQGD